MADACKAKTALCKLLDVLACLLALCGEVVAYHDRIGAIFKDLILPIAQNLLPAASYHDPSFWQCVFGLTHDF